MSTKAINNAAEYESITIDDTIMYNVDYFEGSQNTLIFETHKKNRAYFLMIFGGILLNIIMFIVLFVLALYYGPRNGGKITNQFIIVVSCLAVSVMPLIIIIGYITKLFLCNIYDILIDGVA